jgi:ectoine hydroxylase-related dioxygenase (phytanoyl-CoA dioxygenase family)
MTLDSRLSVKPWETCGLWRDDGWRGAGAVGQSEKMAAHSPQVWVKYYSNLWLSLVSEAWLGPGYQVTSQINVVNPGGEAQSAHRDYHLGLLTQDQATAFPLQVHLMSPLLTLQGAVAHQDTPCESGPTLFLPHSHKYPLGFLAWRLEPFKEYFGKHRAQLPLETGDLVFFNPAVFHAAGANQTKNIRRMANLLQIASPLGRSMETVNRRGIVTAIYPQLLNELRMGSMNQDEARRVIGAAAKGYPFPANLDLDPPINAQPPRSQAQIVMDSLLKDQDPETLEKLLDEYEHRRLSHV